MSIRYLFMFLRRLCLVSGLLLLHTECKADNRRLTLDEVLALFYQQNLDLIAAQYNVDSAKADELIAAALPNPQFGIQVSEITGNPNVNSLARGCDHNNNTSCGPASYFTFSQLIEVANKRGLRMESSGFASMAAEADLRDALRIFGNMVKDAYYDLLMAQKNRWLAAEVARHYRELLDANRLRLKVGDLAEADYLRVKTEAARAESDVDSADALLAQARGALALLLRWSQQQVNFEVADVWPDNTLELSSSTDEMIEQALQHRPDLQADQYRADQAKKQLELARNLKYPDVTLNAGYARDPANNALNSAFVGFSVPLPLFYQYQGETDKAVVGLNQAQLEIEKNSMSIRQDVMTAVANWKSADQIAQRFQQGLLHDAQAVRDSAELAFRKGATSVLELIDAQRTYKTVMRDYYAAQVNRANAYYDLEKALGVEHVAKTQPQSSVTEPPK